MRETTVSDSIARLPSGNTRGTAPLTSNATSEPRRGQSIPTRSDQAARRKMRKTFFEVVLTNPDDYIEVISNFYCPNCGEKLWIDTEYYLGEFLHAYSCFECRVNYYDDRELQGICNNKEKKRAENAGR